MVFAIGVAVFLSVAMAIAWYIGRQYSGRIDSIWTIVTGVACLAAVIYGAQAHPRAYIIGAFFVLWLIRLASYLWKRATSDDPRYAALKQQWGAKASQRMFQFLQVQAVASWPLVYSAYIAAASPRSAPDWRDVLGALVFLIALAGESLADSQMSAFRRDPANKGKVCDRGLWSWSRHPNYFFEWLGWVGLPLMAIDGAYPWGWLALLAPATMYVLLVYLSGIPPLEQSMRRSRGAAFDAYCARVSAFWPTPPKRA